MTNTSKTLVIAAALAAASTPALAVNMGDLGLSDAQIRALNAQLTAPVTGPGISFGSPIAFGAGWGEVFAGVGGNTTPPKSGSGLDGADVDGSASLGFGIGNAYDGVGLETVVTAISVRDNFGEDGDVHFKLHHALENRAAFAIGVESVLGWGAAEGKNSSTYAVYTQVVDLVPGNVENPIPLSVNVGLGEGRFVDQGREGVEAFGSLAVAPFRQMSVIADWTGRDANAAISLVPFPKQAFTVTLGAINLGRRYGNDVEFAGGIGYLFRF